MALITIVTGAYKPTYNWGACYPVTSREMIQVGMEHDPVVWM